MLDTVREIHTPEGVALRLPAAGPVPRALAWLIDLAIRFALVFIASIAFGLLGSAGMGLYLVLLFLVLWGYPVAFEALWHGQTPGKRALGLRVVAADGAPVGWMASFLRNLMRTVDMLPFGYAFGLAASLADPWSRRLGDVVARTMVVHVADRGHGARPGARPPLPGLLRIRFDRVILFRQAKQRLGATSSPRTRAGFRRVNRFTSTDASP